MLNIVYILVYTISVTLGLMFIIPVSIFVIQYLYNIMKTHIFNKLNKKTITINDKTSIETN